MNHTYRLVWNRSLSMFVAVSECARAMGKSGGGKAIAAIALVASVVAAPQSLAHTTSIGYELKPANSVQIWYGTYHTTGFTEGSLSFTGSNGYAQTVSFIDLANSKPVGLIDGTTNFFTDGVKLIGTPNRVINTWQGVTFQNLTAGTYTFNYIPLAMPTADWEPWDNVIRTGSFVITAEALASAGGGTTTIDTQASSYDASTLPASGTLAFEGGTLKSDIDNATLAQDFTVDASGGTLDQAGNNATFTGNFADAAAGVPGALSVSNSGSGGQVVLAGVNTYTGATTVNAGATLALSGSGSIAASSGVTNNGTLVVKSDAPASIASIAGNGAVQLAGQDLVLTNAADTFAGTIGGSGGVRVDGGVQQLSNVNTYTGATTVAAGATLALGGSGSIASSSGVTNNGTLVVGSDAPASIASIAGNGAVQLADQDLVLTNAADTFAGTIGGSGGVRVGGGVQQLANGNTYTGATTVDSGATLALAGSGSIAASSGVTNNGTLVVASDAPAHIASIAGNGAVQLAGQDLVLTNAATTFAGTIDGSGGVRVEGGVQQLSNANTYTGATGVAAGATLALSGNGSIAASSGVTNNGTLIVGSDAPARIAGIAGNGAVQLAGQDLVLTNAAATFAGTIGGSGGVRVDGGAQQLSNANAYTGATTVAAGATLALSGSGSIAASSGVTNNGTLVVKSDAPASIASIAGNGAVQLAGQDLVLTNAAATFAGTINGSGGVRVTGGVQQLSGANTFTGTVGASTGGTIRVASDASLGASGNAVALDGGNLNAVASFTTSRALGVRGASGVQVDSGATLVSNGAVSGSGTLVKAGAGTLVLGGNNSALSGGISINGGSVKLASATAAGSGAVQINAGTLQSAVNATLGQNLGVAAGTAIDTAAKTTLTVAGNISALPGGVGCFTKSGLGTLNVAGSGSFGNGVCVAQGELRANGLIGSTFVTVFQGATLRGSGAINAPITVSGTLAPGNSPGTLIAGSTVTMAAGSTFQADINGTGTASGPGNYSRLIVSGAGQFVAGGATLAPNLVNITGTDVYTAYVPQVGESYRIVTAGGGVVGRFGTLVQPQGMAADTRMALFYDANGNHSIDLRVLPGSYARFAATQGGNRNAQQSGAIVDGFIGANQSASATAAQSSIADALSTMSGERLALAVEGLGGEVHAALAAAAPLAGQSLQRTVQGQLGVPTAGTVLWADLSGNHAGWSGDATSSGLNADRGQLTVGLDAFRGAASRVGVGFAHGRADVDAAGGSGKLRENMLFAYGEQRGERVILSALAGVGRGNWSSERANPLAAGQLRSDADGRSALASVGLSLPVQWGSMGVAPFARVMWQRSERDAVSEQAGAPAALSMAAYSATGVRTTVGVAGAVKRVDESSPFTLRYSAAVGHDNGSLLRPVVNTTLAGVASFVAGPETDRAFFEGSLSGTMVHNAKTSSFFGVSTELRGNRSDVSVTGGLRYAF